MASSSFRPLVLAIAGIALSSFLLILAFDDDSPQPQHLRLAQQFAPSFKDMGGLNWHGQPVNVTHDSKGVTRYSVTLQAEAWEEVCQGVWRAARPFVGVGEGAASTLSEETGAQELRPVPNGHLKRENEGRTEQHKKPLVELINLKHLVALQGDVLSNGAEGALKKVQGALGDSSAFLLLGPWVYLLRGSQGVPSASFILDENLELGWKEGGSWRVAIGPYSADGIPLLPSQSTSFKFDELDVVAGSILRARTIAVGDSAHEVHFRVLWNAEVVMEWKGPFDSVPVPRALEAPIGPGPGTLVLEVLGTHAGFTAFLKPVICPPRNVEASPLSRDVVLLLADTFRADNLAAWGGIPAQCPRLNRFAKGGRRFLNTRAPASYTLPSQAAMLSGLYPLQINVAGHGDAIPPGVETLAEQFQKEGYRTVAITDGGFVGRTFGFAQGFEWFEEGNGVDHSPEKETHFATSVAEELRADDGRPLFLFVQNYRAHSTYDVDPDTAERLDGVFHRDLPIDDLGRDIGLSELFVRGVPVEGLLKTQLEDYKDHYRCASADTDRLFGFILDALEEVGILDDGVVVFTSDHGEGFGEHGTYEHGQGTWGEELDIPLIIHAPGLISPIDDSSLATLVDLPKTLTKLAGISASTEWTGRDLSREFDFDSSDPLIILSYQSKKHGGNKAEGILGHEDLAVEWQGTKWILDYRDLTPTSKLSEVSVLHVYDKVADPRETHDLHGEDGEPELPAKVLATVCEFHASKFRKVHAELYPEKREELKALGYTDPDEE